MTIRSRFLAAALLLALPITSTAQDTDPSTATPAAGAPAAGVFTDVVSVRVINVEVVVTDRAGNPVAGLGPDDFEIRVDGKTMPISNFYAESSRSATTPVPATEVPERDGRESSFRPVDEVDAGASRRSHVVILIDHPRLRATNRQRAFAALREAVAGLDADALISVVGVEGSLVFYSDFLFDRGAVESILDEVSRIAIRTDVSEAERRRIFDELARGISGGIQARASLADPEIMSRIQSYAASEFARGISSLRQIETVVSTLTGVPGRKILLYVGEGIPTRPGEGLYVEYRNRFSGPERGLPHQDFNTNYNREVGNYDLTQPMQQLAKAANRAGVTIYSIDAAGNHGGEIRSVLTEQGAMSEAISKIDENYRVPLEYAAKATGGRFLISSGKLADQLVDMVEGLRTFYSLGFTPPADWEAGTDHDLKVKVKGKGLRVRHREEIRLPKADEREAGATVAALMYQTVDNPLAIGASPGYEVPREDGTAVLPVNLEIPIGKLGFLPQDGAQAASLSIYVSTKDAEGNPGKVQKIPFHLAIPDDKMEEASADSAHYTLPLILRKGDRQVAIGVRDNVSGLFSAIRLDVSPYSRF